MLGLNPYILIFRQNTVIPKADILGQDHSTWKRVPAEPHCLQHSGDSHGENLDILKGVRYHLSSILCVSSTQ